MTLIIMLAINSLLLIIFTISNIILLYKNRNLKSKIDQIKYWIAAIDRSAISTSHDRGYLAKVTKILEDN